ncbi:chemotaxis-specific protein-glutamate methyltransferase CheB [Pelomonas sp. KK5]|uniref:chemotaxis-specific protein-glutamate methyltransferase CheB n=1 Tax=Pelomonas sp. KK5 TaxID=1855730 RepID=UPI00097CA199|nr:chemotaxis-specific protein-glutamate methyltransferase CheB [Pelomonas sp. KK5]
MIRILIADDSPSTALLLRTLFDAQPDMEVVGHATNGAEAVKLCAQLKPAIVTMDVRMPEMDGIEATRRIMQDTPTPVVVVSALVDDPLGGVLGRGAAGDERSQIGFRALEVGALAVLQKPPGPGSPKFKAVARDLIDTVRAMSAIKVFRRRALTQQEREAREDDAPPRSLEARDFSDTLPSPDFLLPGRPGFADTGFAEQLPMMGFAPIPDRLDLVAVAASTGGPQALADVLATLPADFPVPVVVVQHIAEGFIGGLAEWLDGKARMACGVAADGEVLTAGRIYLAPDGHHLLVVRTGTRLRAQLLAGAPVNRHLPSATPFFQSVARSCGRHALGLVLTGMGDDGADGLVALRRAGGVTLAQSPATCVAPSMPQTAIERHAIDEVVPLARITLRLKSMARI